MKQRQRGRALFSTLVVLIAGALVPLTVAAPAEGGSPECEHDPTTRRVSIAAEEWTAFRREGRDIQYKFVYETEYSNCDGATVDNTDLIDFTDTSASGEILIFIDLSRGHFTPGATPENQGLSEIEFRLRQEAVKPKPQFLFIEGTDHSDFFIGGARGMKLNRDNDLDVEFRTSEGRLDIDAEAGNDEVYLDGRNGTGPFNPEASYPHVVHGDRGNDVLVGSTLEDILDGGAAHDRLRGGAGNDDILSEGGDDRMWGQDGKDFLSGLDGDDYVIAGGGHDKIKGDEGDDHLEGSRGDDRIVGGRGNDHLDGDSGIDICYPGGGKDTKEDCERGS